MSRKKVRFLSTNVTCELFSLKWNDHKNTFFDFLSNAREKKLFCDATLVCEGKFYLVHRFVLSTCSDYFEKILENISAPHPVIVLANIKPKEIEDLLQYMYTGEVKVLQEDIDSLIKAGEVLKIKGIGVSDEIEKPKKQKRFFDDGKETFEKRQRTDEFGDNSRLNEASPESKTNKEANVSFEDCNEDTNGIGDFLHPSKQPISESTPVKEELLESVDDTMHFPEHNVKVEFSEPLIIEEEDLQLPENGKFERTTGSFQEQESSNFHDASTSSISLAQNMHLDWIMQNDQSQERMPLSGMCLVCGDKGSGYHYGIETCGGCNCFFKRSIKNNIGMDYNCVLRGNCDISRENRGSRTCKACRFQKCIASGMNMNNVKKNQMLTM